MNFSHTQICQNKKGKFVIVLIGQPGWHMMDWNGCNFRRMALPKELRREFVSVADALRYSDELETAKQDYLEQYAKKNGDGSYYSDSMSISFDEESAARQIVGPKVRKR